MAELRLNTRELQAPILYEGFEAPTRVFTKRGTYRILLSRNLETENTSKTVNACNVFFAGQSQ